MDESGQDTRGRLFVVSVVVTDEEREALRQVCERVEQETGKGRVKWIEAPYRRRLAYIQRMLKEPLAKGALCFALYASTKDYSRLTIESIAQSLRRSDESAFEATVLIDGLPRSQERVVGLQLRRMGIPVRKVRGVKKDENEALIRLADAVCGLSRAAFEGQTEMRELFERGVKNGLLRDVSGN